MCKLGGLLALCAGSTQPGAWMDFQRCKVSAAVLGLLLLSTSRSQVLPTHMPGSSGFCVDQLLWAPAAEEKNNPGFPTHCSPFQFSDARAAQLQLQAPCL